jgi:hypothetical protein
MWNLSDISGVVPPLLRAILPRAALAVLFVSIGSLTFFESVYLAGQAAEFGSPRIARWLRFFQVTALVLFGCSAAVVVALLGAIQR